MRIIMWGVFVIGGLAVAACDASDATSVIDATDAPPTAEEECAEIYARVTALVTAADRTCTTGGDCVRFGGTGTCNCAFFLGNDCNGDPMSRSGFDGVSAAAGDAFERWFELSCSVGPMVCDCGPAFVDCVAGACTTVSDQSCFPFFDAGVDAP